MSDNINRLPDEILIKIFNLLSAKDQISLEIVCVRWQTILLDVLQSETSLILVRPSFQLNHHQLNFFDPNFYGTFSNQQNWIKSISKLTTFNCETLVRKVPNVTKLVLIGIEIDAKDFAQIIFPNWSQLESLHFGVVSSHDYDWIVWQNGAAQNLTNLKHLALLGSVSGEFRLNWSFFRQLETLCLELEPANSCSLNDLFQNVGPGLRALSLTNIEWNEEQTIEIESLFEEEQKLAKCLANNLNRLTFQSSDGNYTVDSDVLCVIAENFTALTQLDVHLSECTLMTDVVHRNRLTSLTNSRLTTNLESYDQTIRLFDGKLEHYQDYLNSVKILHLDIRPACAPKVYFYTNVLPRAFPFLEEIRFENRTGSMYQCSCTRLADTDEIEECKCPDEIFDGLMQRNLQFVYRNDQLVFDRSNGDVHAFKQRLQLNG